MRQMHEVFKIMFDNRLIFPPISPHRLKSVLDCGYGTGSWILDVAAHPGYRLDEVSPVVSRSRAYLVTCLESRCAERAGERSPACLGGCFEDEMQRARRSANAVEHR